MKLQIAIILGTRPEAIKLIPVYLALKSSETLSPILISTGQHKEMLDQIFQFFNIAPDHELHIMMPNQTLAELTSKLFQELSTWCQSQKVAAIMVQGDTTTAMVAAMIGFYTQDKIIHVEAGLRTYNKNSPFPEEINRRIIGLVADINFAPTNKAAEMLLSENASGIFNVGNTVIDSLMAAKEKILKNQNVYAEKFSHLWNSDMGKIILITGHRRESFGKGLLNICEALRALASKFRELNFVYPVHLNPNIREIVHFELKDLPNITLLDPLPYDDLIYLMNRSHIILTDSGGIQEEAPSFGVPLIVMRDNTERSEGIDSGCAVLSGTNSGEIIANFERIYCNPELYKKMSTSPNPYGDGKSSIRIKEILEQFFEE